MRTPSAPLRLPSLREEGRRREDEEAWALFADLVQDFARARVPAEVFQALRLGRLTALQKDAAGEDPDRKPRIRGIVAGAVLRRLACRAVAQQFGSKLLAATAPWQFALQTRAGTDALAHAVRYLTDADPDAVVVSLDGVGAFDHVRRAAFFRKLMARPELRELLPLVAGLYGSNSRFVWRDAMGEEHLIEQGEGGEQGDPLMPALYALAQHDALEAAAGRLEKGERLFAFLDDLYVVTTRARAAAAFKEVAGAVERHAGVQSHLGKLRAWCRGGGPAPADVAELGPKVWRANLPDDLNGLVVLGAPLGRDAFVQAHGRERLPKEERLLEQIQRMKDPQCAWAMLSQSAVPRATHTLRTVPPTLAMPYARAHDQALWSCFCTILAATETEGDDLARQVATLPGAQGGLGLRSAERTAESAYWASWVDALPVLHSKAPDLAAAAVADLTCSAGATAACLQEAELARGRLVAEGGQQIPTWGEAVAGAKPPQPEEEDAAGFYRGWQRHACSVHEHNFAEHQVWPASDEARRALLRSQGSGDASAFLRAVPSEPALSMNPLRFMTAVRRRLRWPLPLTAGTCRGRYCRAPQDTLGDHPASCPRSGLLKLRSRPLERTWARILREAGARVRENFFLRDAGLPGVDPGDGRRIEVVASGLALERGVPLAVDAKLVSPLRTDGTPHPGAAWRNGTALASAVRENRVTYPELVGSSRLRLVTAAVETGGRLSKEARRLLEEAAAVRARAEPKYLRGAVARALRARWTAMVSIAAQDALAATLVDEGTSILDAPDGAPLLGADLWLDGAGAVPPPLADDAAESSDEVSPPERVSS